MESFNSGLLLSSSQVGDLLGVHVSTVKRWTRDGELRSRSTHGGHRRVHLEDALETARSRGIATFLDPFAPFEAHVWEAVHHAVASADFRRSLSLAMGWLMREYPERIVDLFVELGLRADIPFPRLLDGAMVPFREQVTDAASQGRLRRSSAGLVEQLLSDALVRIRLGVPNRARIAAGVPPRRAVLASLEGDPGDLHLLGLRVLLEKEKFEVVFLGAQVPGDEVVETQRAAQASLVCIGVSPHFAAASASSALSDFAAGFQPLGACNVVVVAPSGLPDLPRPPVGWGEQLVVPGAEALALWLRKTATRGVEACRATA
jgi:excisionase family DNA binding protein